MRNASNTGKREGRAAEHGSFAGRIENLLGLRSGGRRHLARALVALADLRPMAEAGIATYREREALLTTAERRIALARDCFYTMRDELDEIVAMVESSAKKHEEVLPDAPPVEVPEPVTRSVADRRPTTLAAEVAERVAPPPAPKSSRRVKAAPKAAARTARS